MSDRKKGNVPSKRPPHRDSNRLQPPSDHRYPGSDENPFTGPPSGSLYAGYDEHGFSHPENSLQPYAAESHPQGHTTRSRPQSYGTQQNLNPYDARHHPQQDLFEGLPLTPTPNRNPVSPRTRAGTESRRGTGDSSRATRRPTDRDRYSDEPAEIEDSAVAIVNENTGRRRSRRENEPRYESTAENEQSALSIRGETTVATRRQPDNERRSDKKFHSGKARKSRKPAEASATGVKISGGAGKINVSYDGNFDVNIKNDAQAFDMTLRHQDDKSEGHHSEDSPIESSLPIRTTGRLRAQAIESSHYDPNTGWSRTKAIEPSRGSQSTQPTGAQVQDFYDILGCTIHDSAKEITRKGMNKEKEIFDRGMRRMSKEETEDLNALAARVSKAFYVLNDKNRRRAYDEKRDSLHGNQGSR